MGMPHPMAGWTVADVLQLPEDGKRYEVVDGELLVTTAPSLLHQEAVQALHGRLKQFVDAHRRSSGAAISGTGSASTGSWTWVRVWWSAGARRTIGQKS
jgi:hypothetical protein